MVIKPTVRLQKYLAECGISSRRRAEELIKTGRVSVDGTVITEMGVKIDPDTQSVHCDGRLVTPPESKKRYYLLNKPSGFVTTLSDPQGRPIVTSLLKGVKDRVYPVGRLDLDTEGALILTNDGELTNRILHPRFETNKTYEATVKGQPARKKIHQLEQGIIIDGQKTWPAKIRFIKKKEQSTLYRVVIHEGRKRQIRKMFQAIGHPVIHLKRIAYGKLTLGSLKTGDFRPLEPAELKKIFL
ncbi:MAG: rRNA pseudouridine synthase [Desulfobulbaceae bacterium]|nr:MAG: rRNA pseudouridine synthase [Desulfobulbaceae bacterium]